MVFGLSNPFKKQERPPMYSLNSTTQLPAVQQGQAPDVSVVKYISETNIPDEVLKRLNTSAWFVDLKGLNLTWFQSENDLESYLIELKNELDIREGNALQVDMPDDVRKRLMYEEDNRGLMILAKFAGKASIGHTKLDRLTSATSTIETRNQNHGITEKALDFAFK